MTSDNRGELEPTSNTMSKPILYHSSDARSFRVLWALEEIGCDYELELLPFPPRVRAPRYLELNPLGTIPPFCDGVVNMTESAAIVHYLAAKHPAAQLAVTEQHAEFGAWLNWLHFGEATLTFPQTIVLRYQHLAPPERRNPALVEDYRRWFLSRLRAVTRAVSARDHLCAGRFTAADISVGYALLLAEILGLTRGLPSELLGYWDRLRGRSAFQQAKLRQGPGLEIASL